MAYPPAGEGGASAGSSTGVPVLARLPVANVVAAAAGAATASAPAVVGGLRTTWRALSEWGDSIERKHFDGDFLSAVSSAPRKVREHASRIGEELGTAAVKLVEEAQGKAPTAEEQAFGGAALPAGASASASSSGGRRVEDRSAATASAPAATSRAPPSADRVPGLWEERDRLQAQIAEERDRRRGRAAAASALDESLRVLRQELVEERRRLADAEEARLVGNSRVDGVERVLEELQEEHHSLQGRKAALEAEVRRYAAAAAAAERAERQASREGAWAREGPETEALKDAKMALAEVLSTMDEAKLRARKEADDLRREIEAARAEGDVLRQRGEFYAAPKSFRASLRRLLSAARGRENEESGGGTSGSDALAT